MKVWLRYIHKKKPRLHFGESFSFKLFSSSPALIQKSSKWPKMCHPVYFRAVVSTTDCCFQRRSSQTQRVQSDQETESRQRFFLRRSEGRLTSDQTVWTRRCWFYKQRFCCCTDPNVFQYIVKTEPGKLRSDWAELNQDPVHRQSLV